MGAFGLALAQSIMAAIEVFILFTIMSIRFPDLLNNDFGKQPGAWPAQPDSWLS